jgi:thioredoxin reductase
LKETVNTCIIGAGPGGITAAIQLKRCGIDFVIIENNEIGGLLRNANLVENYPGFPEGISGQNLVKLFIGQLYRLHVDILEDTVINADHKDGLFHTLTASSGIISSKNLVIASGTRPRKFEWGVKKETVEDRLFYEVVHLKGIRDKRIAVVGAGDAAFDYSLNLARKNKVVLLNRGSSSKCLPLLYERVSVADNIEYLTSTRVVDVVQEAESLSLLLRSDPEKRETTIRADYLLAAIGRVPSTDFLSPVIGDCFNGKIKISGLYFAGDVVRGLMRQASVSVGDGMRSAMDIYLRENEDGRTVE